MATPMLLLTAVVTVANIVSPGLNVVAGVNVIPLPATVLAPPALFSKPPRWLLNTLRAGADAALSIWLNWTDTALLRGALMVLGLGLMEVMLSWARSEADGITERKQIRGSQNGRDEFIITLSLYTYKIR
ncbi:hypothetical protein GCM10023185_06380 [Hymenobacter saemangeumensis]|uniref:Uncharacterized protein n=1 Tax=Hymenobacter saemangeumensis TaxID=1084522 RepID=A0ABP8I1X4_9BACT